MLWLINWSRRRRHLNFTSSTFICRLEDSWFRLYSATSNNGTSDEMRTVKQNKQESCSIKESKSDDILRVEFPEEPMTCCMSGCANCVWLEYAEKLTEYYKDGGHKSIKEINEKITDQNIKAYLLHEIRMRNIKQPM